MIDRTNRYPVYGFEDKNHPHIRKAACGQPTAFNVAQQLMPALGALSQANLTKRGAHMRGFSFSPRPQNLPG
ncbi:hypothetical protein LCGC14_0499840 [marine sediment metagenome]|uniref:Uncharacterized protein n=1 Tax=marine sediment metagenome TaxID=412755 RepID=A0A0F9VCS9_9ZZZZ